MKQVNFQIEESTYEILKKLKKGRVSDFIRQAIDNELKAERDSAQEFRRINQNVKKIDSDSLHQALGDLLVTAQIIFEEQRKQNEVIKLTHRRATLASGFAGLTLDELTKSSNLRLLKHKEFTTNIDAEIKKLNF
jgi:predicted CopG family antitoxin